MGTVSMPILDFKVKLHVVADTFDLPYDGILGCEFLYQTEAKINYSKQEVQINIETFPFEEINKLTLKRTEEINKLLDEVLPPEE